MTISPEEVSHVAHLARLELTGEELELFRGQLGAVLERARRIQSLDLDDVPPTAHPIAGLVNVVRPDESIGFGATDDILRAAPATDGRFITVPQILEDQD